MKQDFGFGTKSAEVETPLLRSSRTAQSSNLPTNHVETGGVTSKAMQSQERFEATVTKPTLTVSVFLSPLLRGGGERLGPGEAL